MHHNLMKLKSHNFLGVALSTVGHNHGGGTNYQCLPLVPEFDQSWHDDRAIERWSWAHPVEYINVDFLRNLPTNSGGHDVPCARCHTTRGSLMMMPAKMQCPHGWTSQYTGKVPLSLNCASKKNEKLIAT